jgi:Ca2+-binding RTX toxin-like protein
LGIDVFIVDAGTDTITGLGQGGADVLAISAGATANATINTAWTATSATRNQGGSLANAVITTSGLAVNLSGATANAVTEGYTVTNTGVATTLTGSAADDSILGGAGNDSLIGGAGDDTLIGGAGADSITGGTGADTFVQANGSSVASPAGWSYLKDVTYAIYEHSRIEFGVGGVIDVITDFDSQADRLDASASGATDAFGIYLPNATIGNYFVRGSYNQGTGTFSGTSDGSSGSDILFYVSTGTDQRTAANLGTTSIVLLGAGTTGFNASTNII